MKKYINKCLTVLIALLGGGMLAVPCSLAADETNPVQIEVQTGKYAAVKGDVNKFRAINWMKDGYSGGISSMSFDQELKGGGTITFEGHSIPAENDNAIDLSYVKGDRFYFKTKYKSFRKYFDNTGGVYSAFPTLKVNNIKDGKDLDMDMGDFLLETGLGPMNDPDLSFAYEQRTKTGAKSLLNWTAVVDSGVTRLIGPSWESVDNLTDVFTLKGKKSVAGVLVKGEQKVELDSNHSKQYKKFIDTNVTDTTTNKLRTEEERSDAKLYATSLRGEKWTLNDSTFLGLGYHYQHTSNDILDQLQEFKQSGSLFNYSSPRQTLPSPGKGHEDEHVWTGNMQTDLTPDLTFISKGKFELQSQRDFLNYLYDTSTAAGNPNGIADRIDNFGLEQYTHTAGENFSLRYGGIAHTSLYAEVEMEQSKNTVTKTFSSVSSGSTPVAQGSAYDQEQDIYGQRTSWVVGGRNVPSKYLTFTAQFGQHYQNDHYNTVREIGDPGDVLNALGMNSDEATTKVTWKPYHWFQNSLRYQIRDYRMYPRAIDQPDQSIRSENRMLGSTYTYDVTLMPLNELLLTLTYSWQNLAVKPVSGSTPNTVVPGFNSGINSWGFSSSYSPRENISLINTINYSKASNFQNLGTNGLSLGSSFNELNATTGLQWSPKKGMTVSPTYEYASYDGNTFVDDSSYSAHIVELTMGFDW